MATTDAWQAYWFAGQGQRGERGHRLRPISPPGISVACHRRWHDLCPGDTKPSLLNAWICLVSSRLRTTAPPGGSRYKPPMSRALAANARIPTELEHAGPVRFEAMWLLPLSAGLG
jgi:hypothetical protein